MTDLGLGFDRYGITYDHDDYLPLRLLKPCFHLENILLDHPYR